MANLHAAIPAAPRKTLREWIEADDGDTPDTLRPACSAKTQALHARVALDPNDDRGGTREPLVAPAGLRLPPLG